MATASKHKRREQVHRIDHLEQMIPYLFALGCARAWMTLTFAAPESAFALPFDPHAVFDYAYAITGIIAAALARRIAPLQERPWAKPLALGTMLASTLLLIALPYFEEQAVLLSIGGAIFGAFGFCLVLLLFAEALVPLSLIRIALYTAASRFIAVPLAFLCQGLDGPRFILVVLLLPFIAIGCVSFAYRVIPERDRPKGAYPKFSFPWKPIALLAIYSFAYGLRAHQLPAGAGIHSSLSTALVMGIFSLQYTCAQIDSASVFCTDLRFYSW